MFEKNKSKVLDSAKASETLKILGSKREDGKTKIADLVTEFHENGIMMAIIFFSLPVAIPLPYPPGFTTVMGLPLMILSLQMLFGSTRVYLPSAINNYEIKNTTLIMLSKKIVPILQTLEKYIKPRFGFAKSVYCEQFVGLASLIAAFSVALPIPFTNAIPAMGITIMTLGLLNRDGLTVIIGFLIGALGVLVATSIIIFGVTVVKAIFYRITGFFT